MALWLIRAGSEGENERKFLDEERVYLTWDELEDDLTKAKSREAVAEVMRRCLPNAGEGKLRNHVGQVWAFCTSIAPGDWFALPSKFSSTIHFGEITGPLTFDAKAETPFKHYRTCKWIEQDVPRSRFDQDLLYSLGAFLTICRITRNDAEARIRAIAANGWQSNKTGTAMPKLANSKSKVEEQDEDDVPTEEAGTVDLEQLAHDSIARMIDARFKGHGLARLVESIDRFVERMYALVHQEKPWVQVGISPFGIARPGVPKGIEAGIDQFAQLYADVPRWLQQGWLDYLSPQLYWPIDQKPQAFAALLAYWHSINARQRHIWPGINPGRALEQKPPTRPTELADQIELIRSEKASHGQVHFSFKALRTDAPNVGGALRHRLYQQPAVAPASPWLGGKAPAALSAELRGDLVLWRAGREVQFVAVQVLVDGRWSTHAVVGAEVGSVTLPKDCTAAAVTPFGRTQLAGPATTVAR